MDITDPTPDPIDVISQAIIDLQVRLYKLTLGEIAQAALEAVGYDALVAERDRLRPRFSAMNDDPVMH
jgi:hypothetical protein